MLLNDLPQLIGRVLKQGYRSINRTTSGMVGIVLLAGKRFDEERGTEAAASLAYYTLFSFFPLLILLVVIGSFFLEESQIRTQVSLILNGVFPTAAELIDQNLDLIIRQRNIASLTGLIGLIWAGTGALAALARNVNRAWRNARPRNIVIGRVFALSLMVVVLLTLLIITLISTVASEILAVMNIPVSRMPDIANAAAWGFSFLMFFTMYRWLPKTRVPSSAAGWSALAATILWRLSTTLFSWLMGSGWANFQLIYGTLGSVIALMLWIYFSSVITLAGAHLSASIARYRRLKRFQDSNDIYSPKAGKTK